MKLLVDANPLYGGPLTGVGYYTQCLVDGLDKIDSVDSSGFAFNLFSNKTTGVNFEIDEQKILPGKLLSYPRHANIELPLEFFFSTKGADVILGTNYLLPPNLRHIPSIITIHDLCFIDHPEWVQSSNAKILKKLLPKTIARSSGVITISEFSLSRIREIYNYTGPALVVDIPPKISMAVDKKPEGVELTKEHYFLFVGTIEPRKNLKLALDAFEKLPKEIQKKYPFVLAGKPGWDPETLERLRSNSNKNIHYLDYVIEGERTWLYKNATATIIPSHYEGFGMMTLESLVLGTPTITSDIPPQREILGDSGEYFSVNDTDGLTSLLDKFTNKDYQKNALKNQTRVLKKYSWDNVINNIIGFVEKIITL